jgi:hypothetical protein
MGIASEVGDTVGVGVAAGDIGDSVAEGVGIGAFAGDAGVRHPASQAASVPSVSWTKVRREMDGTGICFFSEG